MEDSVRDEALEEAEKALCSTLYAIINHDVTGGKLPLIFVRIRTPEHMAHMDELLQPYYDIVTGYILPKFDLSNCDAYKDIISAINIRLDAPLYIMPILESRMIADIKTRTAALLQIECVLDSIKEYVLNVRVVGNDFSNLYSLRRSVSQNIYQIGLIRDILIDIINVFAADYVVSSPVWEYFGADTAAPWGTGLQAELSLDRLNGFIGKTAIHPSQLPLKYESMKVRKSDYEDALRILDWVSSTHGVAKSADGSRMNELKCHGKWARRIAAMGEFMASAKNNPIPVCIPVKKVERRIVLNPYTAENIVALAKRYRNTKRTYLLVNPLQAKHLPISPSESIRMMRCLGVKLAQKYPAAKLVIGFAETATAIAAVAAGCLGAGCKYIHTTRESYPELTDWIYFNEEHSHAVEQKLYAKSLDLWIAETPQIIFVDDEISTGKTLINIVRQLRKVAPGAKDKQIVACAVVNRLSAENERRLENAGIKSEFLVKLSEKDLTDAVSRFESEPAAALDAADAFGYGNLIFTDKPFLNPRLGVNISKYQAQCQSEAEKLSSLLGGILPMSRILVLGTEECMYPALILGQELERTGALVKCHATTRSPIGVCQDAAYPIHSGFKLHSFF